MSGQYNRQWPNGRNQFGITQEDMAMSREQLQDWGDRIYVGVGCREEEGAEPEAVIYGDKHDKDSRLDISESNVLGRIKIDQKEGATQSAKRRLGQYTVIETTSHFGHLPGGFGDELGRVLNALGLSGDGRSRGQTAAEHLIEPPEFPKYIVHLHKR